MIGFAPDKKNSSVNWRHVTAGAESAFCTRFLCQPFDVIKIRFQLQIEPISRNSPTSKYRSIGQSVACIVREEGVTALWKGHIASQLLSVVFGMIQFSSFQFYTELMWQSLAVDRQHCSRSYQPTIHFVSGAMSGLSATVVAQPLDVIRTRFVSQGEPKTYLSIGGAFKSIVTNEGFRGLFRGLVPTVVQIAPYTGTQFAIYHVCNRTWINLLNNGAHTNSNNNNHNNGIDWTRSVCCGAVSGLAAKSLLYPFDFVKKRLQVQGFQEARHKFGAFHSYSGTINCIVKVLREEKSWLSLYKGFTPSLLKAAVTTAINFTLYEKFVQLLNDGHNDQ